MTLLLIFGLRNFFILIQRRRMELKEKKKKNRPHNANALNISRLISPMIRLCNVCNVLKLDTHAEMEMIIVRNMHKIIRKLYFKNNQ